jgi:hypothetical protein
LKISELFEMIKVDDLLGAEKFFSEKTGNFYDPEFRSQDIQFCSKIPSLEV